MDLVDLLPHPFLEVCEQGGWDREMIALFLADGDEGGGARGRVIHPPLRPTPSCAPPPRTPPGLVLSRPAHLGC